MIGWKNGHTEKGINRWIDGWRFWRTNYQIDGRMDGQMNGWINGQMDKQMND